jgi:hypothetical protein
MTVSPTSFDITNLSFFALVGIIVKLFFGGKTSESGLSGPATASLWGYGICAVAVLGLMVVLFGLATQMTNTAKYNTLDFVKALLGHSIPPLLTLGVLTWLITINGVYYKRINEGKVADEYGTYSIGSTVMVVGQLLALFAYLRDELKADKASSFTGKGIKEALSSQIASVIYLLTIGNVLFAGIMTIILKYFSTDG